MATFNITHGDTGTFIETRLVDHDGNSPDLTQSGELLVTIHRLGDYSVVHVGVPTGTADGFIRYTFTAEDWNYIPNRYPQERYGVKWQVGDRTSFPNNSSDTLVVEGDPQGAPVDLQQVSYATLAAFAAHASSAGPVHGIADTANLMLRSVTLGEGAAHTIFERPINGDVSMLDRGPYAMRVYGASGFPGNNYSVLTFGYNMRDGGGTDRPQPLEASFGMRFENDYDTGTVHQFEWYLEGENGPGDVNVRPLAVDFTRATGETSIGLTSYGPGNVSILTKTGSTLTPRVSFSSSSIKIRTKQTPIIFDEQGTQDIIKGSSAIPQNFGIIALNGDNIVIGNRFPALGATGMTIEWANSFLLLRSGVTVAHNGQLAVISNNSSQTFDFQGQGRLICRGNTSGFLGITLESTATGNRTGAIRLVGGGLELMQVGGTNGGASSVTEVQLGPASQSTPELRLGVGTVGFYNGTPVAKQTGVAVTAAAIHAALVNLGLIGA